MVAVEVATNGVDFSASNASYVYIAAVRVLALLPSAGPTGGSTNVSVIGSSLLRGSSCRFGGLAAVSSHWVSSNELVCESPAQTAGSHAVEVSSNAQDWSGSGVRFAYQQPLRVHALSPLVGRGGGLRARYRDGHGGAQAAAQGRAFT